LSLFELCESTFSQSKTASTPIEGMHLREHRNMCHYKA
jgi:hypothetical protein